MNWAQVLLVAAGGAIGSLFRYGASSWILQQVPHWRFPVGTFAVNLLGCFVIGILGGLVVKQDWFSHDLRLFLFTGLIGGFTTFSAFGLETFYLLRRGEYWIAGSYIAASVLIGLLAVWIGFCLIASRNA